MAIAYGARVAHNVGATNGATETMTTTASIPAGSLIIISVSGSNVGDTSNLKSVTDGAGNTYVSGAWTCDPGQNTLTSVWYCANCLALASSSTITVTFNSALLTSGESWEMAADYVTGVATSSVTDGTNSKNSQTGATWVTNSITTTNANDLVWVAAGTNQGGAMTLTNAGSTPTSGWTTQTGLTAGPANANELSTAYQIFSATGTYQGGGTAQATNNGTSAVIIAFKAAGGGGGTNWNQPLSDKQSALDTRFSQVKRPVTGDVQSATDISVRSPAKLAADATSGTDATGKTATKPASDALSGLDALAKGPQKALFETQSGLDSLTKATTAVLGDSQSALDALSHLWSAHLLLSEAISGLDAVQKALLRALVEYFSETDSVNAAKAAGTLWSQTISDHFSEVDVLASWSLVKLLGDAYSGTDVRFGQVGRALYDVSSGNDGLVKQLRRSLQEATSSVDRVTAGKVLLLTLLDQVSLLDTPMTSYTKTQYGLLAMLTSLVASSLGVSVAFASSPALAASTTLLASALAITTTVLVTSGLGTSTTLLPTPLGMTYSLPF